MAPPPSTPTASQFDTQRQKAFEFVQDTTKQVIVLSTAILSLTITFADKLERERWDWLLNSAWVLYVLTIICGIWVLFALSGTLEQIKTNVLIPSGTLAKPNVPVSIRESNITIPASLQLFIFLLATILIVIYAIFAPRKGVTVTDTAKLVAEIRNQTAQISAMVQKIEIADQSIKNLQDVSVNVLQEMRKDFINQLNSFNQQVKINADMRDSHHKALIEAIKEVKQAIEDKQQP
jgi:hypothetical protein